MQGLVSRRGSCCDGFQRLRILAGRVEEGQNVVGWTDFPTNGMSTAVGDRFMALACVVGAICRDTANLLVLQDLAEQIG